MAIYLEHETPENLVLYGKQRSKSKQARKKKNDDTENKGRNAIAMT